MDTTTPRPVTETSTHKEESYTHFLAHEMRLFLVIATILALVATVITMATFWFFAFIPAIIFFGCLFLLIITAEVDERTEHGAHAAEESTRRTQSESAGGANRAVLDSQNIPLPILKRESKTIILIGIGIGAAAFVTALIMFGDATFVFFAAMVIACYMLLLLTPVWLGWIEKEVQDETWKLKGQAYKKPETSPAAPATSEQSEQ